MINSLAAPIGAGCAAYAIPKLIQLYSSEPTTGDTRVTKIFLAIHASLLAIRSAIVSVIGERAWEVISVIGENGWLPVFGVALYAQQYQVALTVIEIVKIFVFVFAVSIQMHIVRKILEVSLREPYPGFAGWIAPKQYQYIGSAV